VRSSKNAPDDGAPILAAVLRRPYLAAQLVHHQLHAVADAQHRDALLCARRHACNVSKSTHSLLMTLM